MCHHLQHNLTTNTKMAVALISSFLVRDVFASNNNINSGFRFAEWQEHDVARGSNKQAWLDAELAAYNINYDTPKRCAYLRSLEDNVLALQVATATRTVIRRGLGGLIEEHLETFKAGRRNSDDESCSWTAATALADPLRSAAILGGEASCGGQYFSFP